MTFWFLSATCASFFLCELCGSAFWQNASGLWQSLTSNALLSTREASATFLEFEETLQAGLALDEKNWNRVLRLEEPWKTLGHESLQTLRSSGASLIPTLRRIRMLAQDHLQDLQDARNRSAQALFQALTCAVLVPLFGFALDKLMPGLDQRPALWLGVCSIAAASVGLGALWMLKQTDQARWAGLSPRLRPALLAALCCGERVLTLVRSGLPPDLAWQRAIAALEVHHAELAQAWGFSVWRETERRNFSPGSAQALLMGFGDPLRASIQVSLMDGKPCSERLESALDAFRRDYRALLGRELQLLPQRCLKPLFICVAPALFFMLVASFWIAFRA